MRRKSEAVRESGDGAATPPTGRRQGSWSALAVRPPPASAGTDPPRRGPVPGDDRRPALVTPPRPPTPRNAAPDEGRAGAGAAREKGRIPGDEGVGGSGDGTGVGSRNSMCSCAVASAASKR